MALTVGELNAVLTIDDRTVTPALRRAEQALRQTGQSMGGDADDIGQRVGRQLGAGLVRGADGQWRTMRGDLADAATAAVAEAERIMRQGGQRAGQQLGDGIVRGADGRLRDGRGRFVTAGQDAGDALGDGLTDSGSAGADEAGETIGQRLSGRLKLAAAGAGVAAGAVLMAGFQEALSQSQITARLGAQLGTTPAVAQQYGRVAGQLFKDAIVADFQTGADTIRAIAAEGLLPPGATNAQIKAISANAADLASTFDVDVAMAAQAAGIAVKTGLAKNSTEAFDLITKGMSGLGPAGEDLLETINEYGVQFAKSGLSGRTAFGLMRQAIQAGWKDTDKVADAFKELELRVTGGGKAQVEALKSVGLNADQMIADLSAGGERGEKAMAKIHDSIVELGPQSDVAKVAIQDLFGGPGEDLGAAFFKLNLHDAAKAMDGTAGAADKLGGSLRDNAGARVTAFKNTLQQTFVEFLGSKVIPPLEKVFGFVQKHSGVFIPAAAGVTALGLAFSAAAIGVWAMNSAMLANPMFWIIAGIGVALAGLVILIVTYWDQIKSATMTAWNWVVGRVVWAKDAVLAAITLLGALPSIVSAYFGRMKDRAVVKMGELVVWVAGLPGRAKAALSGLQGMLASLSSKAFQKMKDTAVQKAVSLVSWLKGFPGQISRGIGSLTSLLEGKGRNVVQGLYNGVRSMGGWIKSKLISWAKSMIPGPIAKALGIASPSKVTKAQGQWIARGLVDGLTGSSKQVRAASYKLVDIVRDGLTGKKRQAAFKRINKDAGWLDWLAQRNEKVTGQLKTAQKKLDDLVKTRDKLASDVKNGVLGEADITKADTGGWPQTAETILAGLRRDTAAAQTFAANLAKVRKKGVRADLIAQIAQAGVSGGAGSAAALASANSAQVKQINSQQAALVKAAGSAGSTAGDAMYGAGIQAAKGLVKGLQSQQKTIENTMARMAKGLAAAMKKALKIKSPSRVMAELGAYTALGVRQGIEGERRAVNASMASLVETPAPGGWQANSRPYGARGGQRTVIEFRSSGRGVDNFITEAARRSVRKKGGGDVDLVLAGRRAG
ncbi:phage tail tape measure protein [Streptomyces olivaceus]|uniref:phage tail tape measure protein n=1 Tax=Streptomyces olivaceus TaxID=47716 RepID=UPI0035E39B88